MSRPVASRPGRPALPGQALLFCFDQFVRLSMAGVWVRGRVPAEPVVWAMNHHHWWDAFASGSILRSAGQFPTVLVSDRNLASFPLLRLLDAVPAAQPDRAVQAVRAGRTLIIMPEGAMLPPAQVGPVRGGAGRIAAAAGVPLVPVALRVVLRGQQHPEVYVDVGEPVAAEDLHARMDAALSALDAEIATAAVTEPLPGYRLVVPGRASVNERLQALARLRR
jgi:1-acyl-sn-glycerol-3-phosphate acyltransferase